MLKVGTKVIVTTNDGKEFEGEIEHTNTTRAPYHICFDRFYSWFREDGTEWQYGKKTFRVKENTVFKAGDKVLSNQFGEGVVVGESFSCKNCVEVKMEYRAPTHCYDKDTGKRAEYCGTDTITLVKETPKDKCDTCFFKQAIEIKRKRQEKWLAEHITDCVDQTKKPVVEVKRRAKVGEYVKITNASPNKCKLSFQSYENGNVFKVDELGSSGAPKIGGDILFDIEYVVLENYVPKEKKIDPKVGMYVKVTTRVGRASVGSMCKLRSVCGIKEDGTYSVTYFDEGESSGEYSYGTIGCNCKLLPNYKPMRKWTDAEIQEAKIIAYECMFNKHIHVGITNVSGMPFVVMMDGKSFTSKPCPTDEPNEHIGRMVTLCRATGRELPKWIKKEEKR